jgi:hypothetical protein
MVGPSVVQAIITRTGSNWMGFPFLLALCAASSLAIFFFVDVERGACGGDRVRVCVCVTADAAQGARMRRSGRRSAVRGWARRMAVWRRWRRCRTRSEQILGGGRGRDFGSGGDSVGCTSKLAFERSMEHDSHHLLSRALKVALLLLL